MRGHARRKLKRLIEAAPDDAFMDLCWAVDALQTGRAPYARPYLTFPSEAASARFRSKLAIHPWELETLLGELLLSPKRPLRPGPNRILNCRQFGAMIALVNALRAIDEEESGVYLKRINVLDEMHRIAQRQFPWQGGYFNRIQFYRFSYIYGGSRSAEFFHEAYGLSLHAFSLTGFALYAHFHRHPVFKGNIDLSFVGVSSHEVEAALRLIAAPVAHMRSEFSSQLANVRAKWQLPPPMAYRPSLLRRYPVISFAPTLRRSPLPELIPLRVTAGIYYDLLRGGQPLRNEASKRFQKYSAALLTAMLPALKASEEYQYWHGGQKYRTLDILVRRGGCLAVVIECKASKLTYDAQYAEDPLTAAKAGYDQLAKGIFQIWRFFAHVRMGSVSESIGTDTRAILLTLDTWLMLSRELRQDVLAAANALAVKDPNITADDKREIVFCSIKDFERTLMRTDEAGFFNALTHATAESFTGWLLPDVHRETSAEVKEKAYPFELADVLPWFGALEKMAESRANRQG